MKNLNYTSFKIEEIRATIAEKEGEKTYNLSGYAALFEKLSVKLGWFREKIAKGAFEETLKSDIDVKALWNHNRDIVLGATKSGTLKLSEDKKGLKFSLELPDTQAGRDAYISVNRGDVDGMSFGFNTLDHSWNEVDSENIIRTLNQVELHEISITPFPAYKDTSVQSRSIKDDYENYKQSKKNESIIRSEGELELKKKLIDL